MQVYAIELADCVTITLKRDDNGHPLKFNNGRSVVLALNLEQASRVITSQQVQRIEWLGEVDAAIVPGPGITSVQGVRMTFNPLTEVMSRQLLLDRLRILLDIESDEHLFLTVAVLDSSQLPLHCSIESYALSSEGDSRASLSDGTELTGSPVQLGAQLRKILEATHRTFKKQANLASSFGAGPAKIEEMLKNKDTMTKLAEQLKKAGTGKGCGIPGCPSCDPKNKRVPALTIGLHTESNELDLSRDQHEIIVRGLKSLFDHMGVALSGISFLELQD